MNINCLYIQKESRFQSLTEEIIIAQQAAHDIVDTAVAAGSFKTLATALTSAGLVKLRRFPEHSLIKFCEEVRPSLVVGDENPMREPEAWRRSAAMKLSLPLWTVDADVIVPSKLLEKAQYAAHIIRSRLQAQLGRFLVPQKNTKTKVVWRRPEGLQSMDSDFEITQGWPLDTSVGPVSGLRGGTNEALRLLEEFIHHGLSTYGTKRNKPELNGTSRLSPYLHFGHISSLTVALAAQEADEAGYCRS